MAFTVGRVQTETRNGVFCALVPQKTTPETYLVVLLFYVFGFMAVPYFGAHAEGSGSVDWLGIAYLFLGGWLAGLLGLKTIFVRKIEVGSSEMKLRTSLLGLGRTKIFPLKNISRFCVGIPLAVDEEFRWGLSALGTKNLQFDFGTKTEVVADNLDGAVAMKLFEQMREHSAELHRASVRPGSQSA